MHINLDEPRGFRHENNEKQAALTFVLLAVMAIISVALILWAVKFVPGAG